MNYELDLPQEELGIVPLLPIIIPAIATVAAAGIGYASSKQQKEASEASASALAYQAQIQKATEDKKAETNKMFLMGGIGVAALFAIVLATR